MTEKNKKKDKEILSVDERLRKEEEDLEEADDFGLHPAEFAEEMALGQLPPREKDCELTTRDIGELRDPSKTKKTKSLTTRDLKEK